jgi:TonB family protein
MKVTALTLIVILLMTGTFFIGCSLNPEKKAEAATPGSDLPLPGASVKKEVAAPLPQQDHKEADSPRTAKIKVTKLKIHTIVNNPTQCSEPPPPPAEDDSDSIVFTKVEIEAEYPGGAAAWQRFLNRNLRYPQEAIDNEEIHGAVVVQFVVDKEGNVSNVERVSGPEALGAEAVRVIKKSGRWTPAVQGGRQVRSLKKQPFIIHFESEG